MIASIVNLAQNIGYPTLVLLVLAESAGVPLPGEIALITAASLAGQDRLALPLVIVLAAAAAIVGDNLGYLAGHKGGRWLLQRPGLFARQRARVLETGEPFFVRHGPKAVFLGRWILGLRTWASWLAGASRMPWHAYLLWNAAGAISWATTLSIVAYYAGHSTAGTAALFGVAGLIGALAVPSALIARRKGRRHGTLHARAGRNWPSGRCPTGRPRDHRRDAPPDDPAGPQSEISARAGDQGVSGQRHHVR